MNGIRLVSLQAVRDFQVPTTVPEALAPAEREALMQRIKGLLKVQDAVVVAHYYTDPDLQRR